jgi:hypothetical protein
MHEGTLLGRVISQCVPKLVFVDARLPEDPANRVAAQGSVEGDDEEVAPVGMHELPMTTPLALDRPSESGHRSEEPPPVDFAGQPAHSHVHRHDLRGERLAAFPRAGPSAR